MISAQTLRVCRRENRFTLFRIMLCLPENLADGRTEKRLYATLAT
jgi:hypothetical protein